MKGTHLNPTAIFLGENTREFSLNKDQWISTKGNWPGLSWIMKNGSWTRRCSDLKRADSYAAGDFPRWPSPVAPGPVKPGLAASPPPTASLAHTPHTRRAPGAQPEGHACVGWSVAFLSPRLGLLAVCVGHHCSEVAYVKSNAVKNTQSSHIFVWTNATNF